MSIRDWSVIPANNGNAAPGINWQENVMFVKDVNDSARAMMADIAKWLGDTQGALGSTGSANSYNVVTNSSYAAYSNGMTLKIKFHVSNTGASYLFTDSLGSKQIYKYTSTGAIPVAAGDIIGGLIYILIFDFGMDGWMLFGYRQIRPSDINQTFQDWTYSGTIKVNNITVGRNGNLGRIAWSNATDVVICDSGVGVGTGFGDSFGLNISNNTGVIWFGTNGTERLRIENGNIGIERSGPQQKLHVNGNGLFGEINSGVYINSGQPNGSFTSIYHAAGVVSGNWYSAFFYNNALIGYIAQSGTTGVAYVTSSDYRLKQNIEPLTGALERIKAAPVCRFKWRADPAGAWSHGYIAHELAEHIPQAVTGEKDAVNEDGSINPQGVDFSRIVPDLHAAVQELAELVKNLSARLTVLEAKGGA